jgi:hypothetical protein
MLQVLETLHLMCIFIYFFHIALQILNCSYKKFKKGKIPYSFLPSLLIHNFIFMISTMIKYGIKRMYFFIAKGIGQYK